jgi:hypothetical protein
MENKNQKKETKTHQKALGVLMRKSTSKDVDEMKKEWLFINKFEDLNRNCVCERLGLKHCRLYVNKTTGEEVIVGGGCNAIFVKPKEKSEAKELEDIDETVEAKIRNMADFSRAFVNETINVYEKYLKRIDLSLDIEGLRKKIEIFRGNVKDNEYLLERLNLLYYAICVKYRDRSKFCNICKRDISGWGDEPCLSNVADCKCITDRQYFCYSCSFKFRRSDTILPIQPTGILDGSWNSFL